MNQNPEKLSYQLRHSMLAIQFLQLKSSYLDNTLRFRLAGVSDLIAAKVKYHKNLTSKSKKESQKTDIAMIFICSELHFAAECNQILELCDIWVSYNTLAQPIHKYRSRLSFDEKLMKKVGDLFEFVQPLTWYISERENH